MNYSVSEVANKLKVSRTIIYTKLKSDEFKDLVTAENGRQTIDESLFKLLESSFRPKKEEETTSVQMFEKVLQTLTEQLQEKDKVITDLLRLTENQQKLLGNAQQQQEVKLLEQPKRKWWQR